jgi:hypothetical protein
LIPHDQITENMTLGGLRKVFECLGDKPWELRL